jgi:SpoVK/Ycf46/Vps4 family AAA+-type ATPase
MLTKTGTMKLYDGNASFDALGGLDSLKAFTRRALVRNNRDGGDVRAHGVMLLSPPGCGKSEFCKALGREVGRPVLQLDVGALMGSLVGQSEERTRQALAIVDAMAPCILMIDEVEKAFAGAGGSGTNDSGVSARMFGTVLSWLNDHTSDVFVVCTSNDASRLPPEFSRSERFDATFFLDLPGREEKDCIWMQYLNHFGLDTLQDRPDDSEWTGAEIKAACRLAALLDVPITQSARNVVPVAVTASDSINALRSWASGRCLNAGGSGIFTHRKAKATRRRVSRSEPSTN